MDPEAAEVVAVRKESVVGDQTARGDVGVKLGHPCPDPVGVEDLVPGRVERVGGIDPSAITADLHHLRAAAERHPRIGRVRLAAHDPAEREPLPSPAGGRGR